MHAHSKRQSKAMAIAYLNGEWMAPADARVSVFDRGFMFGDGIWHRVLLELLVDGSKRIHRKEPQQGVSEQFVFQRWQ